MISHWQRDNLRKSDLAGHSVTTRIGRFLVHTLQGTPPGLGTELHYKGPGDLQFEIMKMSEVSEAVPFIMAKSWPCGSRIAVKKDKIRPPLS